MLVQYMRHPKTIQREAIDVEVKTPKALRKKTNVKLTVVKETLCKGKPYGVFVAVPDKTSAHGYRVGWSCLNERSSDVWDKRVGRGNAVASLKGGDARASVPFRALGELKEFEERCERYFHITKKRTKKTVVNKTTQVTETTKTKKSATPIKVKGTGRGRPKGSKNKPKVAPAVAPVPIDEPIDLTPATPQSDVDTAADLTIPPVVDKVVKGIMFNGKQISDDEWDKPVKNHTELNNNKF